jgi:hypothetical protein
MPRTSKGKRGSEVVPVVGAVGLTLSMAGGAVAATSGPAAEAAAPARAPDVALGLQEEEVADINLATFYIYDRELPVTARGNEKVAGLFGCRGCRGCRGCGRCRGCRGCRGCGCGGCGC